MPQSTTLPKSVVATDHRLEAQASTATEELARHRWHWTLDESNPKRVSFREYARQVGRNQATIHQTVNGFVAWQSVGGASDTSLSSQIQLAGMGAERATAVEAIAEVRGMQPASVARHRRSEVKDVLDDARDAAERKGTSVVDEIPRVATAKARTQQTAKTQRDTRNARKTLRYIEIEGHLGAARRRLTDALTVARDVDLDDEYRDLIASSLEQIKAVIALLDLLMVDSSGVNWDAELAKLGGRS